MGNIALHMYSVYEGVKYECNKCEYRASTQGNLICHIQSVHERAMHKCSQCDYGAFWKDTLTRYI